MSRGIEGCVLCGSETAERVMALVEWTEPISRERWSHVPRCVDRVACRERVERVLDEAWPVNDGTPPPVNLPSSGPPEPDPVQASEPSPPVVEEEIAWLRG